MLKAKKMTTVMKQIEEHEHEEEASDLLIDHSGHGHDSHVWLSPVISQDLAAVIKDELVAAMPEQEALFTENYEALVAELKELHANFEEWLHKQHKKHSSYLTQHSAILQVIMASLKYR